MKQFTEPPHEYYQVTGWFEGHGGKEETSLIPHIEENQGFT